MKWHPILAADEPEPGQWRLLDGYDREYGRVTIVRLDGQIRYRAEFRGALLGYDTTLRGACYAVHMQFVRSHTAQPFQGYPDFNSHRK